MSNPNKGQADEYESEDESSDDSDWLIIVYK